MTDSTATSAAREAVTAAAGTRAPAWRTLVEASGLSVGAVASWPAVAGAALAVGLGYGLPAVTALRRVRGRLTPALAGFGAADHVALTFDDGPDPRSTPHFLDVLEELDVRATFFVLGDAVSRAPGLVVDMAAAGHELAIHGWDRKPMLLRGPLSTYDQLARTHELVAAATGRPPRFVRPPHGILSAAVLAAAHRLDLTPVLWTARGRDWERGPRRCPSSPPSGPTCAAAPRSSCTTATVPACPARGAARWVPCPSSPADARTRPCASARSPSTACPATRRPRGSRDSSGLGIPPVVRRTDNDRTGPAARRCRGAGGQAPRRGRVSQRG